MKSIEILNTLNLKNAPQITKILRSAGNLVSIKPNRKKVLKYVGKCHVYLASAAIQVDREFLAMASNLKIIGSPSTGKDHLDLNEITKRGIFCYDISREFNLINSFTATSELAFGLMLSLIRRIPEGIESVKRGHWVREKLCGYQLNQKTLGIIGLGRLGKISAKIANGFGMKVIAVDPNVKKWPNVKIVSLKHLLKLSDIITIHIHLNKETENLINEKKLRKMKKNCILINTSRGKIINESALLKALKNKWIAGAALDVIDGEWLAKNRLRTHPLIAYSRRNKNLIITPHIGGSTIESIFGARLFMAKKIASILKRKKS